MINNNNGGAANTNISFCLIWFSNKWQGLCRMVAMKF